MGAYRDALANENNGAIQVDVPDGVPLFVVLAGPIKVWWNDGMWDSPLHKEYVKHRDATEAFLVKHGILVYKPHTAWRGAWHEAAQDVNDEAIRKADAIIVLTPMDGPYGERTWLVECQGTQDEIKVARQAGTRRFYHPPIPGEDDSLAFSMLLDGLMDSFPDRVYIQA